MGQLRASTRRVYRTAVQECNVTRRQTRAMGRQRQVSAAEGSRSSFWGAALDSVVVWGSWATQAPSLGWWGQSGRQGGEESLPGHDAPSQLLGLPRPC